MYFLESVHTFKTFEDKGKISYDMFMSVTLIQL